MSEEKLSIGDVVQLKIGGPDMELVAGPVLCFACEYRNENGATQTPFMPLYTLKKIPE